MTSLWSYRFDIFLHRVRKFIKALIPSLILSKWTNRKMDRATTSAIAQMYSENIFPWSSPNIWMEIVNSYRGRDEPVIFEFGTGASTVWHAMELLQKKSGTYVGVESDPSWFWAVVAAVLKKTNQVGANFSVQVIHPSKHTQENVDVEIILGKIRIVLRLRPSLEDYLSALDLPCDVIVVDGISRKQCIQKIIASNLLRGGGMLMLMEAGRGSDRWWEGKLKGDSDYSVELQTLLSLGGTLLDGTGLDNWSGCNKRSPRPVSYYYPMEACRLVLPSISLEQEQPFHNS